MSFGTPWSWRYRAPTVEHIHIPTRRASRRHIGPVLLPEMTCLAIGFGGAVFGEATVLRCVQDGLKDRPITSPVGSHTGFHLKVVAEALALERTIIPLRLVDQRVVRFDPALMDQPLEHLTGPVGASIDTGTLAELLLIGQTLKVFTEFKAKADDAAGDAT